MSGRLAAWLWPAARGALFALPAETAHRWTLASLRLAAEAGAPLEWLRRGLLEEQAASRAVHAMGLRFPNPVGLAAGMDKDAEAVPAWAAMGFGFVEVGTVTPRPQAGNPPPRLFRLPGERALLNRMGFNNAGAEAVAARLEALETRPVPIGVNVGKNKDTPQERAANDYGRVAARLGPLADYLVVNVSSPNTPGLRALQRAELLAPVLEATVAAARSAGRDVPVLVKIAPDLDDEAIEAVARLVPRLGLAGVVAVNTTVRRDVLGEAGRRRAERLGPGGISGRPLRPRARQVLRRLREVLGPEPVVVSVGGIDGQEEVLERLRSGATLVQVLTGLVYEGPALPGRIVAAWRRAGAPGAAPSSARGEEARQ